MKKGTTEARAAMAELFAELDRTRKEHAKASLQLTQMETTVQHQRDADQRKDQTIAYLEGELRHREETYRNDLQVLQEEARTKEAAWEHRTKYLEMEVSRLKQEVEAAQHFESDNRKLREAVLEGQSTIDTLKLMIDELKTRAKEDARDHASQLESEFKRRLADSEKKFRAEAYRALSDEAKVALQGNDHLQAVLQRQNDSIESILMKCKQLEQAHAALTSEQDIATQNIQHHLGEIQRLKRQLNDANSRNAQLEDSLQQRKVERASLELLYVEYETTRKQLIKVSDQAKRSAREAERWRQRAVQLTQELGADERPAAEQQLDHIATHGDKLEHHMQRSRARAERRERDRERNANGAALVRAAGGDGGGGGAAAGDNWSVIDPAELDAAEGQATAEEEVPMLSANEILRMWNARFSNEERRREPNELVVHGDGAATTAQITDGTSSAAMNGNSNHKPSTAGGASATPVAHHHSPPAAGAAHPTDPAAAPPMLSEVGAFVPTAGGGPSVGARPPKGARSAQPPAAPTNHFGFSLQPVVSQVAGLSTEQAAEERNKKMSVLAINKTRTLPPPARHFVPRQPSMTGSGSSLPMLSTVEQGELATIRVRGGPPAAGQRFISP